MKKILPLQLVLLALAQWLSAQSTELVPCATNETVAWLEKYQQNPGAFPKTDADFYLPVQIHLVGQDNGGGYFSYAATLDAFATLNKDFAPTGMQFFMTEDFSLIDNSTYYDHTFGQGSEMMQRFRTPNTINSYIVGSPAGACGYSAYNQGVALAKSCTGKNDHTWAHEIGHYLSLPHTFSGWENYEHNYTLPAPASIGTRQVERVDSSNCRFAGDRFCDTPPDYLAYRWTCSGTQSLTVQLDPDSVAFRSDGSLFMSYANDDCMTRFSNEQTNAMRANVMTERAFLQGPAPTTDIVIADSVTVLTPIYPLNDALVERHDSVLLEWEPIPNATHYLVQVNPLPTFSLIFRQYIVKGNSVLVTNLMPNRKHFWRVRPYNVYYTDTDFTTPARFTTGSLTDVHEVDAASGIRVFPNPTAQGNFTVEIQHSEAEDCHWQLSDMLGRTVRRGVSGLVAGDNRFSVTVDGLPGGTYALQLRLGQRAYSQMVVIRQD